MNLLLLSCNTGEGHNSAAKAILEEAQSRGHMVTMKDTLAFASKSLSDVVSKGYILSLKQPQVFGSIYNTGHKVENWKLGSPVYHLNKIYKRKLYEYIMENRIEAVISTHIFPGQALASLKKSDKLRHVRTYGVATDYTCIPFWNETHSDTYFIPHEDLREEFIRREVPADKIYVTGIPTASRFRSQVSKKEARQQLGLPLEKPVYLLMTGSMGFGHLEQLIKAILNMDEDQVSINVICGNNKKLFHSLSSLFESHQNVHLYGYRKDVPLFMDAADVIFTKPGGLTTTEAAVKLLPIIHTEPIPGCESANYTFFAEHHMSLRATTPEAMAKAAYRITHESDLEQSILDAMRQHINPYAAKDILDYVEARHTVIHQFD